MGGLIDLNNTVEEDEPPLSCEPSSSFDSSTSVCMELWHACAGPSISLPKKGSVVVYFPQGQLEQSTDFPAVPYDLPPHIFCRVLHVRLLAEAASDEVYAQVSLVTETQVEQKLWKGGGQVDGEQDSEGAAKMAVPLMFCKTLTASDTSNHGGFSVPRRAAEDCFPPLDYKQQRPSQDLVAKDLHGLEWRFRHIYRGQPRRHLLTTGWSAFINKKNLVSGDAVLFLRGGDGELRLGIRRVAQVKGGPLFPAPCSQTLNLNNFAAVVNSLSTKSAFNIFYNPRTSLSEFIVPVRKFSWSLYHPFSIGMRFKMRFETEDAAEQRYTGVVTGIGDVDPVRWPGSKWKCLLVRWDDIEFQQRNRVSPWEIEPCGLGSGSSGLTLSGSKRTRIGFPSTQSVFSLPYGIGTSDFGESSRFQVLQGQEILSYGTSDGHPDISCTSMELGEPFRFHKVLQGQETLCHQQVCENDDLGIIDGVGFQISRNRWPSALAHRSGAPPLSQVSSPSSVLIDFHPLNSVDFLDKRVAQSLVNISGKQPFRREDLSEHRIPYPRSAPSRSKDCKNLVSSCESSCRLFGFPLTKENSAVDGEKSNHVKPSTANKAVGNGYTSLTNLCAVSPRDACFDVDIAL